ncbi:hypothetical protein MNV49_001498 [Pseudohyphozyma bogoriensis]|nr:hypothetical protein MNV49_001498 [Pseudohyphozyma bogoriensis]
MKRTLSTPRPCSPPTPVPTPTPTRPSTRASTPRRSFLGLAVPSSPSTFFSEQAIVQNRNLKRAASRSFSSLADLARPKKSPRQPSKLARPPSRFSLCSSDEEDNANPSPLRPPLLLRSESSFSLRSFKGLVGGMSGSLRAKKKDHEAIGITRRISYPCLRSSTIGFEVGDGAGIFSDRRRDASKLADEERDRATSTSDESELMADASTSLSSSLTSSSTFSRDDRFSSLLDEQEPTSRFSWSLSTLAHTSDDHLSASCHSPASPFLPSYSPCTSPSPYYIPAFGSLPPTPVLTPLRAHFSDASTADSVVEQEVDDPLAEAMSELFLFETTMPLKIPTEATDMDSVVATEDHHPLAQRPLQRRPSSPFPFLPLSAPARPPFVSTIASPYPSPSHTPTPSPKHAAPACDGEEISFPFPQVDALATPPPSAPPSPSTATPRSRPRLLVKTSGDMGEEGETLKRSASVKEMLLERSRSSRFKKAMESIPLTPPGEPLVGEDEEDNDEEEEIEKEDEEEGLWWNESDDEEETKVGEGAGFDVTSETAVDVEVEASDQAKVKEVELGGEESAFGKKKREGWKLLAGGERRSV